MLRGSEAGPGCLTTIYPLVETLWWSEVKNVMSEVKNPPTSDPAWAGPTAKINRTMMTAPMISIFLTMIVSLSFHSGSEIVHEKPDHSLPAPIARGPRRSLTEPA